MEIKPPLDSYKRFFRMQAAGADGKTTRTTIPRDIVRKEAAKRGIEVKEFLEKFRVVWIYNNFEGAITNFVPIDELKLSKNNAKKEKDSVESSENKG